MSRHFQFLRGKTDISGLTEYISGSNSPPHLEHSQIPYSRKEFGVKFPGSARRGGGMLKFPIDQYITMSGSFCHRCLQF